MAQPEVKQEAPRSPLRLYTISPSNSPPLWRPSLDDHSIPNISLPRLLPLGGPRPDQVFNFEQPPSTSTSASQQPSSSQPPASSSSAPATPTERVARPPNAFMLFRSDFLKTGQIPAHVESRQQNLSRIAGEVWNLKSAAEKAIWHTRAAEVLRDHQRKFPAYKFTPAPRGSRRKTRLRDDPAGMADADVRKIRETYTEVLGPSPASGRRRATKRLRGVGGGEAMQMQAPAMLPVLHHPLPVPYSAPAPGHYVQRIDQSPPVSPFEPMKFPHPSVPRRPSTSMGFYDYEFLEKMNMRYNNQYEVQSESAASPAAACSPASDGVFDYFTAYNMLGVEICQPTRSNESSSPVFQTNLWNNPQQAPTPQHISQLQQEISPLQNPVAALAGPFVMQDPSPQASPNPQLFLPRPNSPAFVEESAEESMEVLPCLTYPDNFMSLLEGSYVPSYASSDGKIDAWAEPDSLGTQWNFDFTGPSDFILMPESTERAN